MMKCTKWEIRTLKMNNKTIEVIINNIEQRRFGTCKGSEKLIRWNLQHSFLCSDGDNKSTYVKKTKYLTMEGRLITIEKANTLDFYRKRIEIVFRE